MIFKLLLCLKIGSYLVLNLSIYSGHLSKSAHTSLSPWLIAVLFFTIYKNTIIYLTDTYWGSFILLPFFFFFGCDNHAAVNIPAKPISELNKGDWLVRRKTVSFSLGRRIGAVFPAHMKCELDLIFRYRDWHDNEEEVSPSRQLTESKGTEAEKPWGAHREREHCVMRLEHRVDEAEGLEIRFPSGLDRTQEGFDHQSKGSIIVQQINKTVSCSSS